MINVHAKLTGGPVVIGTTATFALRTLRMEYMRLRVFDTPWRANMFLLVYR